MTGGRTPSRITSLEVQLRPYLEKAIAEHGQTEVARQSGVPQPQLSQHLNKDKPLGTQSLSKLAEYLGLILGPERKS